MKSRAFLTGSRFNDNSVNGLLFGPPSWSTTSLTPWRNGDMGLGYCVVREWMFHEITKSTCLNSAIRAWTNQPEHSREMLRVTHLQMSAPSTSLRVSASATASSCLLIYVRDSPDVQRATNANELCRHSASPAQVAARRPLCRHLSWVDTKRQNGSPSAGMSGPTMGPSHVGCCDVMMRSCDWLMLSDRRLWFLQRWNYLVCDRLCKLMMYAGYTSVGWLSTLVGHLSSLDVCWHFLWFLV